MAETTNQQGNNDKQIEQGLATLSMVIKYLNENKQTILDASKNLKGVLRALTESFNSSELQKFMKILRKCFDQTYNVELGNLRTTLISVGNLAIELGKNDVSGAAKKLKALDIVIATLGDLAGRISSFKMLASPMSLKNMAALGYITSTLSTVIALCWQLQHVSLVSLIMARIKLYRMKKIIRAIAGCIYEIAEIVEGTSETSEETSDVTGATTTVKTRPKKNKKAKPISLKQIWELGKKLLGLLAIYRIIQLIIDSLKGIGLGLKARFRLWTIRNVARYMIAVIHDIVYAHEDRVEAISIDEKKDRFWHWSRKNDPNKYKLEVNRVRDMLKVFAMMSVILLTLQALFLILKKIKSPAYLSIKLWWIKVITKRIFILVHKMRDWSMGKFKKDEKADSSKSFGSGFTIDAIKDTSGKKDTNLMRLVKVLFMVGLVFLELMVLFAIIKKIKTKGLRWKLGTVARVLGDPADLNGVGLKSGGRGFSLLRFRRSSIMAILARILAIAKKRDIKRKLLIAANVMLALLIVFKSLKIVMTTLLVIALIAPIFILLSPLILLSVAIVLLIIKVIAYMVKKSMVSILFLVTMVAVLLLILLALRLMAELIVKVALWCIPALLALPMVILFMLGLVVMLGILVLIGYIGKLLLPVLYGIGAILLAIIAVVAALVIIALLLLLLQTIKLDYDKIKTNTKKVLKTVALILLWVMEPLYDEDDFKDNGERAKPGFFEVLGTGLQKAILSIMGAVTLLGLLIAVVCIVIMAFLLKLLEKIKLDRPRIEQNVAMIFETAQWILDFVTAPDDDRFKEQGKNDILTELCLYVYPPLIKVFDALVAAATLALLVIAVLCILLIAGMLKLIEKIDLDRSLIKDKTNIVLDSCRDIIAILFAPDKEEKEPSSRGVIGPLLRWVYEPLGPILDAVFALAYLAVMIIAIICLWGIAKMLKVIEGLDLKKETIIEKTDMIIEITKHIIDEIFKPDDENKDKSERDGIADFLGWVYPPLKNIIKAIFALAYLAVMAIGILCLWGIAKMLMSIQEMDLKRDVIEENTRIIISVTRDIMNGVFGPDEENKDKSDRDSSISDFLSWCFPAMAASIVKAIFTLAFLTVMIIAVLIVLGIAKLLEQVGKIDGDILETARTNARVVMDVCADIIQMVYNADDKNKDSSSRGAVGDFLAWVYPPLASTVDSVFALAYLALMVIALSIVLAAGRLLAELAKISNADMLRAGINARIAVSTAQAVIQMVFHEDDETKQKSDRGGILDFLAWIFDFTPLGMAVKVLKALFTIAILALYFIAIAIVLGIATILNHLGKLSTANIKKSRNITRETLSATQYTVDEVFSTDLEIPDDGDDDIFSDLVGWVFGDEAAAAMRAARRIQTLQIMYGAVAAVYKLAELINSIGKLSIANVSNSEKIASSVLRSAKNISSSVLNFKLEIKDGDSEESVDPEDILRSAHTIMAVTQAIAIIASLAQEIKKLQDVNITSESLVESVTNAVMGSAKTIMKILNDEEGLNQQLIQGIITKLKSMEPGVNQMVSAILQFAKKFQSLVTVPLNIMRVAIDNAKMVFRSILELLEISSFKNLDKKYGSSSIFDRMTTDVHMMLMDSPDEFFDRIKLYTNAINASCGLVFRMIRLMDAIKDSLQRLSDIADFDDMSAAKLSQNTTLIFRTSSNIISNLWKNSVAGAVGTPDVEDLHELVGIMHLQIMIFRSSADLIYHITRMADKLQAANIDAVAIAQNADNAVAAMYHMFRIIRAASFQTDEKQVRSNMDLMDRINQSITGFTHVTTQDVKNSRDLTNNYIAFLTKVNAMDFAKLKTTEQLMKHWADMSKSINGNFQGLAQAINEHIMPALKKLDNTMDESVKVQKQIIEDLAKPIDLSQLTNGFAGGPGMSGSMPGSTPGGMPGSTPGAPGTSLPAPTTDPSTATTTTPASTGGGSGFPGSADDNMYLDKETNTYKNKNNGSFLAPYGPAPVHDKKHSAIERCIEGDALRVKIVN